MWKFGNLEVWQGGRLEVRQCGSVKVWQCGSLALWKFLPLSQLERQTIKDTPRKRDLKKKLHEQKH